MNFLVKGQLPPFITGPVDGNGDDIKMACSLWKTNKANRIDVQVHTYIDDTVKR
jgi:hypothetical protein